MEKKGKSVISYWYAISCSPDLSVQIMCTNFSLMVTKGLIAKSTKLNGILGNVQVRPPSGETEERTTHCPPTISFQTIENNWPSEAMFGLKAPLSWPKSLASSDQVFPLSTDRLLTSSALPEIVSDQQTMTMLSETVIVGCFTRGYCDNVKGADHVCPASIDFWCWIPESPVHAICTSEFHTAIHGLIAS